MDQNVLDAYFHLKNLLFHYKKISYFTRTYNFVDIFSETNETSELVVVKIQGIFKSKQRRSEASLKYI